MMKNRSAAAALSRCRNTNDMREIDVTYIYHFFGVEWLSHHRQPIAFEETNFLLFQQLLLFKRVYQEFYCIHKIAEVFSNHMVYSLLRLVLYETLHMVKLLAFKV